MNSAPDAGLTRFQAMLKRGIDVTVALLILLLLWWLILVAWLLVSVTMRENGFFTQRRVGRYGCYFNVIKLRTMRSDSSVVTTVTSSRDPRITKLGRLLRRSKLDELPQLWNVLIGEMSLVGPRPDVPGFADRLEGEELLVLSVRPGITGPATLKYSNEEELLAKQDDAEAYNREVIYPDKVRINLQYVKEWSLSTDLKYLWKTLIS